MTDKEMKKLNRSELLEIILVLQRRQETLAKENEMLKAELERRTSLLCNDETFGAASSDLDHALKQFKLAVDRYVFHLETEAVNLIESKGDK